MGKHCIYFEIITTFAIIIGLGAANVFKPGEGINMNELTETDISKYVETTESVEQSGGGILDTIVSIVPTNIIHRWLKQICYPLFSSQYYLV